MQPRTRQLWLERDSDRSGLTMHVAAAYFHDQGTSPYLTPAADFCCPASAAGGRYLRELSGRTVLYSCRQRSISTFASNNVSKSLWLREAASSSSGSRARVGSTAARCSRSATSIQPFLAQSARKRLGPDRVALDDDNGHVHAFVTASTVGGMKLRDTRGGRPRHHSLIPLFWPC